MKPLTRLLLLLGCVTVAVTVRSLPGRQTADQLFESYSVRLAEEFKLTSGVVNTPRPLSPMPIFVEQGHTAESSRLLLRYEIAGDNGPKKDNPQSVLVDYVTKLEKAKGKPWCRDRHGVTLTEVRAVTFANDEDRATNDTDFRSAFLYEECEANERLNPERHDHWLLTSGGKTYVYILIQRQFIEPTRAERFHRVATALMKEAEPSVQNASITAQ